MLAATLALGSLATTPTFTADDDVYHHMATLFLQEFGYESQADFELDAFLDDHFLRASLGVFELHIPAKSISEGKNADDFESIATSLIDLQATWIDWMAGEEEPDEALAADIDAVRDWVKGWSKSKLKSAGPGDLASTLEADEEVTAAITRLADHMRLGKAVGLDRENPKVEPIVLIPDRGTYVRSIAFAGLMNEGVQREGCWQPSSVYFTEHYYGLDALFLAMRYADPAASLEDYERSSSMDWRSSTGLEQQIAQIASNSMLDNIFEDNVPPSLIGGLSLNLVIELFGECNTRVDGDLRARRTDAREFFVPGGLSEGGRLPPNMADSRWREHGSEDRFARILRESQKAGGKRTRTKIDKLRCFELQGLERVEKMTVKGPFLGASANPESLSVPEVYWGDQLEFLRAYRCAFMHFLRTEAFRDEDDAANAFAKMMGSLAKMDSAEGLEKVMAEAYEAPALSTAELADDELERRFLDWIRKQ